MTVKQTGVPGNALTGPIDQGLPLIVLSPHLDDAVLSCGALMTHAVRRTSVTVVSYFTEAGPAPYTLSARRYLRQVRARDAEALYRQRRAEDRAALEPLGIVCVHAGLTEALFRRCADRPSRLGLARLLPELAHVYPSYRAHVTSGQLAAADAGTLRAARDLIDRVAGSGPSLVLAPLGVGGHVDHVLVRTAAESSGATVVYYSDFPYNQQDSVDPAFTRRNGLLEMTWPGRPEAKAELIRAYESQMRSLFRGEAIPLAPEVFFFRSETLGVGVRDLAEVRRK
jgi:LmbE family N-acetylglucosaminyl deacetylase